MTKWNILFGLSYGVVLILGCLFVLWLAGAGAPTGPLP